MFPGYLFANFELMEMHRQVQYAHGVSSVVRFGDQYPTVVEGVIERLRNHVGTDEVKELNYELGYGDQVQIIEGCFFGLEAVVSHILPGKERIKILMDFLGRQIEAKVKRSSVLRQTASP
jgi:transcriptional antiterminator RfaH